MRPVTKGKPWLPEHSSVKVHLLARAGPQVGEGQRQGRCTRPPTPSRQRASSSRGTRSAVTKWKFSAGVSQASNSSQTSWLRHLGPGERRRLVEPGQHHVAGLSKRFRRVRLVVIPRRVSLDRRRVEKARAGLATCSDSPANVAPPPFNNVRRETSRCPIGSALLLRTSVPGVRESGANPTPARNGRDRLRTQGRRVHCTVARACCRQASTIAGSSARLQLSSRGGLQPQVRELVPEQFA